MIPELYKISDKELVENAIDDCDVAISDNENMIIVLRNVKHMLQEDLERLREILQKTEED